MKASTIINKIEKQGYTSIAQTELLTKALHREKKLDEKFAVRFLILFGKFDIVNADFEKNGVKFEVSDAMTIEELKARFIS